LEIICSKIDEDGKEHGSFFQKPNNHLQGSGCPKCEDERRKLGNPKYNTSSFISKALLKHGDKYDYSLVDYKHTFSKVEIICSKHGIFFQKPNNHLNGQGCPSCANEIKYKVSKGESEVKKFIQSIYDGEIRKDRKILNGREIDIYLPDLKIGIEFNGLYWHSITENNDKKYHLSKYIQCKDKGILLIQIFEDEWKFYRKKVERRLENRITKCYIPISPIIQFDNRYPLRLPINYQLEVIENPRKHERNLGYKDHKIFDAGRSLYIRRD